MSHYHYNDGNQNCNHAHRTPEAARRCPEFAAIIREWYRMDGRREHAPTFSAYRAECQVEAVITEHTPA